MSYHVYITRADFWAENDGMEITADEWLELIRTDPQLAHDESNGPFFALVSGSPDGQHGWLDWSDGNVYANYPKHALLRKMLQIAGRFGAELQGEDGETYKSIDDFPEPIDASDRSREGREVLSAYERRELLWKFVVYGTIAAAIIAINVFDLW